MTRLLVEASIGARLKLVELDFGAIQHWYSEGLLTSPFLPRWRGDSLAEGHTHADLALGDFWVDVSRRGDITVSGDAGTFGVIEAKMRSRLTAGTKNAPHYDQACRNLCCIAFNTLATAHDIFFAVAAPQAKVDQHGLDDHLQLDGMLKKIDTRFEMYERDSPVRALKESILERASRCSCFILTYERWLDALTDHEVYQELREFKDLCYSFNRIRSC